MLKAIATVQLEDVGHFITGVTFRVNFKSAHLGQALFSHRSNKGRYSEC